MNKRFYKYAAPTTIPGHYAYQLPTLLALTGLGTASGALLGKKKKKLEGALFGGISFPLAYLAYLAAQKGYGLKGDAFDRFVNKNINNPVHAWLNPLSDNVYLPYGGDASAETKDVHGNSLIYKPKDGKMRLYRKDNKSDIEEDMGYVPNYGPPAWITLDPETNKYISIINSLRPVETSNPPEINPDTPETESSLTMPGGGTAIDMFGGMLDTTDSKEKFPSGIIR